MTADVTADVTAPMNHRLLLRTHLDGRSTEGVFTVDRAEVPTVTPGTFLVRNEWLSLDPAMRTWSSATPGRGTPLALGSVMRAYAVGFVTDSAHPDYSAGDCVVGPFGLQEWHLSDGVDVRMRPSPVPTQLSVTLGSVGHIGLSALIGLTEIARIRPGDTVLVSSAAGAVGSQAGQIARILGCRTIGIAGGPEKAALCRDLYGFDAAIDYRASSDLSADIALAAPEGIDVFFDNVGGRTLDAVVPLMNEYGRIAICGTISLDSKRPGTGPRWERQILDRQLSVQGFLQSHFQGDVDALLARLHNWSDDGLLVLREDVTIGVASAPAAIERLLNGNNLGKALIRIDRTTE